MQLPSKKIIVFIKNPQLGKVKTRLAKRVGDVQALQTYIQLVNHTLKVVLETNISSIIYWSHFIETATTYASKEFESELQQGEFLGNKMQHAIENELKNSNYVILIGSDCFEIQSSHLLEALNSLAHSDVVLGPATDGGFYLIGMKKIHQSLFLQEYSHSNVLNETLQRAHEANLSVHLLEPLSDLDE